MARRRHHRRHHRRNPGLETVAAFNPHRRHHRHHYRRNPPGPKVLGEDAVDLAVKASGLALTQFVNQQFAAPITRNVFKNQAGIMGKAVDVGTTALSAVVAGEGVGLVNRGWGRDIRFGGLLLTAGKALGTVIPGFSLGTPTLPAAFGRFGLPGATPAGPAVAPAAAAAAGAVPVAALPPGGQANYPRPATVDSDVGL
jgi:hypothetical protein